MVECVNSKCKTVSHIICLSRSFLLGEDQIIPIQGKCGTCDVVLQWGDVVRRRNGCYQNLTEAEFETFEEDLTE